MSKRQIFIVNAMIVGANGSFAQLSGYPKTFDSQNYGNDIDKTLQRAYGAFHTEVGTMCGVDTRQLQTVMIYTADGFLIEKKALGEIHYLPDPEPEPEPAPEPIDPEVT